MRTNAFDYAQKIIGDNAGKELKNRDEKLRLYYFLKKLDKELDEQGKDPNYQTQFMKSD